MGLSVSGFIAIMVWFWGLARTAWESLQTGDSVAWPPARGFLVGLCLFGGAWLWSLTTSLRILRQIRKNTPPVLRDRTGR